MRKASHYGDQGRNAPRCPPCCRAASTLPLRRLAIASDRRTWSRWELLRLLTGLVSVAGSIHPMLAIALGGAAAGVLRGCSSGLHRADISGNSWNISGRTGSDRPGRQVRSTRTRGNRTRKPRSSAAGRHRFRTVWTSFGSAPSWTKRCSAPPTASACRISGSLPSVWSCNAKRGAASLKPFPISAALFGNERLCDESPRADRRAQASAAIIATTPFVAGVGFS